MQFSATPWHIDAAAPRLGQHNREVLCGLLGHDEDELAAWSERGVI